MKVRYVVTAVLLGAAVVSGGCAAKAGDQGAGTGVSVRTTGGTAMPAVAAETAPAAGSSGGVVLADTVTASGTGKALSSPDMAEMTFGTSVRDGDADAAMDAAGKRAKEIADALKKQGVAKADLQTSSVSLYPQTDENGKVSAYHASVSVRATVRDIGKLGEIISAATKAGSNEIMGPSFVMADDNPANTKAIENAVANAKARAQAMAKASGREIGEVVAITEGGAISPGPVYKGTDARLAAEAVPIEPGQLETYASVSVTFELR